MAGWLRDRPSPHLTALAMIGAKSGDRVVVIGARDPDLAAELALKTGLNGQTTVIDEASEARGRVDTAAAKAGALVEFAPAPLDHLPVDNDLCDVLVLVAPLAPLDQRRRDACFAEVMRVLRPSGRVIVIDGARRAGLLDVLKEKVARLRAEEWLALLDRAGGKAARQLADVDGVAFYEARKPGQ